jgi:hypothetical protein
MDAHMHKSNVKTHIHQSNEDSDCVSQNQRRDRLFAPEPVSERTQRSLMQAAPTSPPNKYRFLPMKAIPAALRACGKSLFNPYSKDFHSGFET